MGLERDSPNGNMKFVRISCHVQSYFVCEKEQSLREDLQAYVKAPLAVLPFTKALGDADRASGGLRTKERRVGYDDQWMKPLGFR